MAGGDADAVGGWPTGSALLLTRASPFDEIADDFDAWQRATHLPDLMAAPGAASVFYGTRHRGESDAAAADITEHADRIAIYACPDLARMLTFVGSSEVADAIADGSRWFGRFHLLDGELYSGNVYQVTGSRGESLGGLGTLVVARLEVPPEWLSDFDTWVHGEFLDTLLPDFPTPHDGVGGVRICAVHRDNIPVPYYHSRGNRAVLASMAGSHADASALPGGHLMQPPAGQGDGLLGGFLPILRQWGDRVPYVSLEVFARDAVLTASGR